MAGEQHEGAPAAQLQQLGHFAGSFLGEGGAAGIGQVLRHIQQRLLLIFEVAGHDQGARLLDAQALLDEIEAACHRQRGRGQDHRIHGIEEPLGQQRRDIDGGGLQKKAAAAALRPIHVGLVVALQHEPQGQSQFDRAALQRNDLHGRILDQLQVRADQFQRGVQVAVDLFVALHELGAP